MPNPNPQEVQDYESQFQGSKEVLTRIESLGKREAALKYLETLAKANVEFARVLNESKFWEKAKTMSADELKKEVQTMSSPNLAWNKEGVFKERDWASFQKSDGSAYSPEESAARNQDLKNLRVNLQKMASWQRNVPKDLDPKLARYCRQLARAGAAKALRDGLMVTDMDPNAKAQAMVDVMAAWEVSESQAKPSAMLLVAAHTEVVKGLAKNRQERKALAEKMDAGKEGNISTVIKELAPESYATSIKILTGGEYVEFKDLQMILTGLFEVKNAVLVTREDGSQAISFLMKNGCKGNHGVVELSGASANQQDMAPPVAPVEPSAPAPEPVPTEPAPTPEPPAPTEPSPEPVAPATPTPTPEPVPPVSDASADASANTEQLKLNSTPISAEDLKTTLKHEQLKWADDAAHLEVTVRDAAMNFTRLEGGSGAQGAPLVFEAKYQDLPVRFRVERNAAGEIQMEHESPDWKLMKGDYEWQPMRVEQKSPSWKAVSDTDALITGLAEDRKLLDTTVELKVADLNLMPIEPPPTEALRVEISNLEWKDAEKLNQEKALTDAINALDVDFDGLVTGETDARKNFINIYLDLCQEAGVSPRSSDVRLLGEKLESDFSVTSDKNHPIFGPLKKEIQDRKDLLEHFQILKKSQNYILAVIENAGSNGHLRHIEYTLGDKVLPVDIIHFNGKDYYCPQKEKLFGSGVENWVDEASGTGSLRLSTEGRLVSTVFEGDAMDLQGLLPKDDDYIFSWESSMKDLKADPTTEMEGHLVKDDLETSYGFKTSTESHEQLADIMAGWMGHFEEDISQVERAYLYFRLSELGPERFLNSYGNRIFAKAEKKMAETFTSSAEKERFKKALDYTIAGLESLPEGFEKAELIEAPSGHPAYGREIFKNPEFENGWTHPQKFAYRQEQRCPGFTKWFVAKLKDYQTRL